MRDGLRVRVEMDHFFEWLQEFEQRVQGLGGSKTWYISSAFRARVRYSWYQAAVAGQPTICLADLHFFDQAIGDDIVQAMARYFTYGPHELEARVLVFENPQTPSLRLWLAGSAFTAILAPGEAERSWYLNRRQAVHSTGSHAAFKATSLPMSYWDTSNSQELQGAH